MKEEIRNICIRNRDRDREIEKFLNNKYVEKELGNAYLK